MSVNAASSASMFNRIKAAYDANDSIPLRVVKASLEVPKSMGWGALGGIAIVALPSVMAPPIAPFFLPFAPATALFGAGIGFGNGLLNAAGRMLEGNAFQPSIP